jgi:AcrR family transcriptional regulator
LIIPVSDVDIVNLRLHNNVDVVNTKLYDRAVTKKKRGAYHHGDLRRALLDATTSVIHDEGVDALTLRGVGKKLGVSRTALYRHFVDKTDLLAAVASEGFQALYAELAEARLESPNDPLEGMAIAYVRFALMNPSYFRVMFGRAPGDFARYPDLVQHAERAFGILVETVSSEQLAGHLRAGEPPQLARILWSLVHGIATLGMSGQLRLDPSQMADFTRVAARAMHAGLAPL